MSSRSAARGRAAASSIRLTSRTSKAVATRRAKPSRCFLFCRDSRAANAPPTAAAIVSIPHPPPPAAPNPQLAPQLHGRASALGNVMGGEDVRPWTKNFGEHQLKLAALGPPD